MKNTTLCLLRKDGHILLATKKRGFGAGKLNGAGGKIQEGETVQEAALREMYEEIGVRSSSEHLEKVAEIKFFFKEKPEWDIHMRVFFVRSWIGEPTESEEMQPEWFPLNEIPYERMWSDDIHWLPLVLAGKKIEAECHFNLDDETVERFEAREIFS